MKKKDKGGDPSEQQVRYQKPSTKKHKPVDIVKGSYGYYYSLYYSLYYYSLYYSLYYYSLYYSLYYYSLYYCWVAREVYGADDPKWLMFRDWMLNRAPVWFRSLYGRYGERFARFVSNKPRLKAIIRRWMDSRIEDRMWLNGEIWSV